MKTSMLLALLAVAVFAEDSALEVETKIHLFDVTEKKLVDGFYFFKTARDFRPEGDPCTDFGMKAVSIHSASANSRVKSAAAIAFPGEQCYIGLYMLGDRKSVWYWSDASPVDFTNWAPGEPNSGYEEPNVELRTDGLWNNIGGNRRCFICVAKAPEIFPYGNYAYVRTPESFVPYGDPCEATLGSQLVSIHSAAENQAVYNGMKSFFPKAMECWIGLFYSPGVGWRWSDMTAVTYLGWRPGEPNGNANEPHAGMYGAPTSVGGQWNDEISPLNCYVCWAEPRRYYVGNYVVITSKYSYVPVGTQFCQQHGFKPVAIHSQAENTALIAAVATLRATDEEVWLGLQKVSNSTNAWKWADGSDMDYNGWGQVEPNNYGPGGEFQAAIYTETGKWNDEHRPMYSYICKSN